MNARAVGQVTQLTRYPIKSMAGHSLNQVYVAPYGMYGDRSHAFIDETKEGWNRFITARQIPAMLGYKVEFRDDGTLEEFPSLQVTSPDGQVYGWDEQLLQAIQSFSKVKLSMEKHRPTSQDVLAVDAEGLLIITDRSLNRLERLQQNPIDSRRFRANMLVTLHEDYPEDERSWVGKRLHIGETQLQIVEPCERCSLVTIDPDTYQRDVSILKKINEEMGLHFGVYASVTQVGGIKTGDPVYLTES